MSKVSDFVVRKRKIVILIFLLLAVASAVVFPMVGVNYNMVDYLPQGAQSTTAIEIMDTEFGAKMPNGKVMISGVTVREALEYKAQLAAVEGVDSVAWLDDAVGADVLATTPVEFLDAALLKNYYRDDTALYSIEIHSGKETDAVAAIRDIIGENNAVAGEAVNIATSQQMAVTEVIKAFAILLPVIFAILILTTNSWAEPLLFLASIGVAVIINMGSNIFFGEISFITRTVSPILQLAVSLDYAIFLLHSFREFRLTYEPEEAMKRAMKEAVSAIAASAATTVFGFLALTFMRFQIGGDLGINLVKGVLLSFVSVMIFLPALTLSCIRLIDRTAHRPLVPALRGAGKHLLQISLPLLVAAVIVVVPSFLAQSNAEFMYGAGSAAEASRAGQDELKIEDRFGKENLLALLVPRGDTGAEVELCAELQEIPHVTGLVAYVTTVGAEIPPEYLSADITGQFYSEGYARIILYTDTADEGDAAFATVGEIRDTAARHYDHAYLAGESATLYDMKNVVSTDTRIVNLCAVLGIFLVLLLTFRSLTIPLFLLFTIETAIWINLSFAYFTGNAFSFIGYLVISTVQLGSTVDYAILLTDRYLENRKSLPKKEAMQTALGNNLWAILTSAAILSMAGFTLAMTSTNPIIAELGTLLGRGTLLSLLMVTCVQPALLTLFDLVIQKTTLAHGFHQGHYPGGTAIRTSHAGKGDKRK